MVKLIRHTPFAVFLVIAFLISQTSILFPQRLGSKLEVAGWPLKIYERSYYQVTDVNTNGKLTKLTVSDDGRILFDKVVINILLWLLILSVTYWTYKFIELSGKNRKDASQSASN
jgi:hypothetical protein